MSWFEDLQQGVSSAGEWLGDALGAPQSGSTPHEADTEAHTAHPEEEGFDLFGSVVQGVGNLGRGLQQEGLGAVFDPFGAIDRQEAQHELASRFNVVGEGEAGNDQNTVTEEEFQAIARQYSDIRMGRSNLQLDTEGMSPQEAREFRARTMEDIGDILQTDSGRGLIGSLSEGALEDDGESRRVTQIRRAAEPDDATGGGRWNDEETRKTGFVNYVPGENTLTDTLDARSDVTLYHELVHAYHSTNNTWDRSGPLGDNAVGEQDAEVGGFEYQAAGLGSHANNEFSENAYRRDRMEIGRRGSGMRTLGGSDADMEERAWYLAPGSEHEAHDHDH